VTVTGLDPASLQGDRIYFEHFKALQKGFATISLADCPDLAPILFALAAKGKGARFTDTRRLAIKESNRAEAMATELRKFGTTVEVLENEVIITPTAFHAPQEPLSGHNNHRIVMSLAILATMTGGIITGAEAVAKSFPNFFECIAALGITHITSIVVDDGYDPSSTPSISTGLQLTVNASKKTYAAITAI
jgi:3-phosphoshikimate 1-carboxyvinyltransferase